MLTLEQIEAAILQLSPDQFHQLLEWFLELDHQRWDEQLERDIADGNLEALAEEAIITRVDDPDFDNKIQTAIRQQIAEHRR
jgi:hypothetical protein